MQVTKEFLQQCEDIVAKGETAKAVEKLLDIKNETGYKAEVLSLNSRWKKFSRERLTGTLSSEEQFLQNSKLNKDLLLLLEGLGRELAGEKVVSDLFRTKDTAAGSTLTRTYLPMLLTAIAVGAISYFALRTPDSTCETDIELDGDWVVTAKTDGEFLGHVNIIQNICEPHFMLSGNLSSADKSREVDFSSKIGGFNDGEILFVYENFSGEIGVCRGIIPAGIVETFSVKCVDLIGADRNDSPNSHIVFDRVAK
ncbi:MAG: hypothetical protein AAF990_13515 [Bacteroidota bacterium]